MPCTGPELHVADGRANGPPNATDDDTGERWLNAVVAAPGASISTEPVNHQLMVHIGVAG